jgi:hypothetical protein
MTSAAAVRQARFRSRQRDDRCVYRIEVERDAVIQKLIRFRLTPAEALNRDLVERELSPVIADSCARPVTAGAATAPWPPRSVPLPRGRLPPAWVRFFAWASETTRR